MSRRPWTLDPLGPAFDADVRRSLERSGAQLGAVDLGEAGAVAPALGAAGAAVAVAERGLL